MIRTSLGTATETRQFKVQTFSVMAGIKIFYRARIWTGSGDKVLHGPRKSIADTWLRSTYRFHGNGPLNWGSPPVLKPVMVTKAPTSED